jgi:hypothetical protein
MPSKSRATTPTAGPHATRCPTCGHLLAEAMTEAREHLWLDTQIPTWVIGGKADASTGLPIVHQSGGYPVHKEPCT